MLKNIEGQKIPNVTFPMRKGDEWVNVSTTDIFAGKNVVVFSLPGAFTPTCSSTHLPRYNELAGVLKENGIDDIVCISVNDTFVMNAWMASQEADNITVIPDGTGQFTDGMGMLVDKSDIGFGKRSWRYSMLVKDGVITKMFIEPNKPGDPFEVSDADTMLEFIAPKATAPSSVSLFTKPGCPFCIKSKALLKSKGISFEEIVLGTNATNVSLRAISGKTTVPQLFIDGKLIGDSEQITKYFENK